MNLPQGLEIEDPEIEISLKEVKREIDQWTEFAKHFEWHDEFNQVAKDVLCELRQLGVKLTKEDDSDVRGNKD